MADTRDPRVLYFERDGKPCARIQAALFFSVVNRKPMPLMSGDRLGIVPAKRDATP